MTTSAVRPTPLDRVPRLLRLPVALLLAASAIALLYGLATRAGKYTVVGVSPLLALVITPLLTPLLAMLGVFRYHSRFLISMPTWKGMVLHLGTGFDRIVHRRELGKRWSGHDARAALLASVLDGLIAIAERAAAGSLAPETRISAASHFFRERTARSFGFEVARPNATDYALFVIGWFEMALWLSVLQGRPAAPSWSSFVRVHTTAGTLATNLSRLRAARARVSRRASPCPGSRA